MIFTLKVLIKISTLQSAYPSRMFRWAGGRGRVQVIAFSKYCCQHFLQNLKI